MSGRTAYVIRTPRRIAPFGDEAADALIIQKTLRQHQREALTAAGYDLRFVSGMDEIPHHAFPCLALTDDLYFNAAFLRKFLQASEKTAGSTQAAISKDTAFSKLFAPFKDRNHPHRVRLSLFYLRQSQSAGVIETLVDLNEHKLPFYIPSHMRGRADIAIPLTAQPALQVTHAVDILFANMASLHARFAAALDSVAQRLLLIARTRSTQPARLLSRMNRVGSGCDIHPTACLEGAEIGNNVQIGANAVIRMSSIGDGCQIGDGSVVKHSVVGSSSVLFNDLTLAFAVCYPETFLIHGPYHLSVFGRSSAMFATILDDFRLDGRPIRIDMDGELVEFPFPFIGSFIGHRTRVAGGSIIGPGRTIPNDLLIFPSPGDVLSRIRNDVPPGVPLFIQNGELKEFENAAARKATSAKS